MSGDDRQFRPNMGHESYNGPHYNDPTDPDQYQQYDYFDQFSIYEDDDGCEPETYYDDAGDGTETEIE